jgi:hypothetical protein
MMRKELAKIDGVRATFQGTFVRLGQKNGYRGPLTTVLLSDIRDLSGNPVCDHLWFNYTKGFSALNLWGGELVEFDARVAEYEKGYKGRNIDRMVDAPVEEDYKLGYPTKIHVVKAQGDI